MISLGLNKTETMFMIFFYSKHRYIDTLLLIFFGAMEAILTSICIVLGYFMFMYRFLGIKWADIFGLQSDIFGLVENFLD